MKSECPVELIRAERLVIKPGHVNHAACKRYCGAARRVYNAALYQMRQALFAGTPIFASQADKFLKLSQRDAYQPLPSAGAQRTTQVLGDHWKSWIAAKRDSAGYDSVQSRAFFSFRSLVALPLALRL